jgi:hypothetical protein
MGLAAVIALLSTELLVEFGGEVDRAVGCRQGRGGVERNQVGERHCSQEQHLQAHGGE